MPSTMPRLFNMILVVGILSLAAYFGWTNLRWTQDPRDRLLQQNSVGSHSANSENQKRLRKYSFVQMHMAMPVRITVWCDSQKDAAQACKRAFKRVGELVKIFSDYDADSEVRRLERENIGVPVPISDHLMKVLLFAKELHARSDHAFDPTMKPLTALWRTARQTGEMPDEKSIKNSLTKTGFDKIAIDIEKKTVTRLSPEIKFDLGGIAKGYIGDQVIDSLKQDGIEIANYQAGGDIVLGDAPPGSKGWSIDIGKNEDGSVKWTELENCAVSTSGDSVQFVLIAGKRYSHVIDPRSGIGLTHKRTAFVIAPTGLQSDALATTGCILEAGEFQTLLSYYVGTKGWSTVGDPPAPQFD